MNSIYELLDEMRLEEEANGSSFLADRYNKLMISIDTKEITDPREIGRLIFEYQTEYIEVNCVYKTFVKEMKEGYTL